jgi:hypothetical protein
MHAQRPLSRRFRRTLSTILCSESPPSAVSAEDAPIIPPATVPDPRRARAPDRRLGDIPLTPTCKPHGSYKP